MISQGAYVCAYMACYIRIITLNHVVANYGQLDLVFNSSFWFMTKITPKLCCVGHPQICHTPFNSLRSRQNRRHFADDVFKCNFLNENVWIPIKNSLKFVPRGPFNNIPALVQIMAWRRTGDKPLSEPMMIQFNDTYMRHSASMS